MATQPPIRVLIADDHRLFAETLGLTLGADPRLEVVEAVLELAVSGDPRRKEVTRGERGVREAFAGLPHDLLQFRARLAH